MRAICLAVVFLAAFSSSAHAQVMMADILGQTVADSVAAAEKRERCLKGEFETSENVQSKTKARASMLMRDYLKSATANPSDVSLVFVRKKSKRYWSLDGEPGNVAAVSDPVAQKVTAKNFSQPTVLVAGDGRTAVAQWLVSDPEDPSRIIAHYKALMGSGSKARFERLEVRRTDDPILPTIAPYCVSIGDVQENLERLKAEQPQAEPEKNGEPK